MKIKFLSDNELVELYVTGKQAAIEELIKRHQNRVYSFIMITVRNTEIADDIFQETFIKVINSLRSGKYADKNRFSSWVIRIAHNLMMDHFRLKKRSNYFDNQSDELDIFDLIKCQDENIVDKMISEQICDDLQKLLNELPAEQKQIIHMRHYMQMTFLDIAEELDINLNTALGRMRYALTNIRKIIKEKNIKLTIQ